MTEEFKVYEENTFQPEDWLDITSPPILGDTENGVKTFDNGAKSGRIDSAFQLIPAQALALVSRVLYEGHEKYGKENWYGLPIEDNVNHAIRHIFSLVSEMQHTNRVRATGKQIPHEFTYKQVQELAHAACRILFALEQVWDSYLHVRGQLLGQDVEDV